MTRLTWEKFPQRLETFEKNMAHTLFQEVSLEWVSFLKNLYLWKEKLSQKKWLQTPLDDFMKEYHQIYLKGEKGVLSPVWCCEKTNEQIGKIVFDLSYSLYQMSKTLSNELYEGVLLKLEAWYLLVEDLSQNPTPEYAKSIYYKYMAENIQEAYHLDILANFNIEKNILHDVYEHGNNINILFRYGLPIHESQKRTFQFLNNLPQEKLKRIAKTFVGGYLRGREIDEKPLGERTSVILAYAVGQEPLVKAIMEEAYLQGLKPCSSMARIESYDYYKQLSFDSKFSNYWIFEDQYHESMKNIMEKSWEHGSAFAQKIGGILAIEEFGAPSFVPQNHPLIPKYNDAQMVLMQAYQNSLYSIRLKHIPSIVWGFSIIAFPSAEIGEQFENIFEDTLKINSLDSKDWSSVQAKLIDVLDQADYVHIKGSEGNKTDLQVKMQTLKDPSQETLFINCGADVNIPVGEVFTSPQLQGTNGVLHVSHIFLEGKPYQNLEIHFKDGYTEHYLCDNYPTFEENQKYLLENLLFPHQKLPLGEFAIGTNTYAYKMAQKYNIEAIMPILIVEKMGPHFAIGDTCFSRDEDRKALCHISHKEIVAKDNEKSLLRKTNMEEAYTNVHTDITLPYRELEFIDAVLPSSKRIRLLEKGRFVLPGTEIFNQGFDL